MSWFKKEPERISVIETHCPICRRKLERFKAWEDVGRTRINGWELKRTITQWRCPRGCSDGPPGEGYEAIDAEGYCHKVDYTGEYLIDNEGFYLEDRFGRPRKA
jgi:hypothetical protein